jgi:hypothetical protein
MALPIPVIAETARLCWTLETDYNGLVMNYIHADYMTPSTKTMPPAKKSQHKISFHEGGLHASTGTSLSKRISPAKHAAAKSGKLGPKAQKQEIFYENVLKHRKS